MKLTKFKKKILFSASLLFVAVGGARIYAQFNYSFRPHYSVEVVSNLTDMPSWFLKVNLINPNFFYKDASKALLLKRQDSAYLEKIRNKYSNVSDSNKLDYALQLAQAGLESDINILYGNFIKDKENVESVEYIALTAIAYEKMIPFVQNRAENKNPEERYSAVDDLSAYKGNVDATELLNALLNDSNETVASNAKAMQLKWNN